MAAAALERSMNANVLRRWVVDAERAEHVAVMTARPTLPAADKSFVALPLPVRKGSDAPIRIEVRRGSLTVSVQWPSSAIHECAMWLREVLK